MEHKLFIYIGIPGASDDTCNRINGPTYTDGEGQYDAFRCSGIKHKMIAYESLDWDAKSRRLSPILVQQRVSGVPYCFIVNGPQDHGCCSGYNCNKRQSLFHSLVAMSKYESQHWENLFTDQTQTCLYDHRRLEA